MSAKYDPSGVMCGFICASGQPCKNKRPCRLPSHVAWHGQQAEELKKQEAAAQPAEAVVEGKKGGKKAKRPEAPPKPDAIAAPAKPVADLDSLFETPPEAPKPPEPVVPSKPVVPVVADEGLPISWQAKLRRSLEAHKPLVIAGSLVFLVVVVIFAWHPWSRNSTTAPADEVTVVDDSDGKEEGEAKKPTPAPKPEKPDVPATKTTELGVRWTTCPATSEAHVQMLGRIRNDVSATIDGGELYVFYKADATWGHHIAKISISGCEVGKEVWRDVPTK